MLSAVRRWILLLASILVVVAPRLAFADASSAHTVPVAVLSFDSDDAEEQADALTGALRSRVRASQGWSLIESSQSLGMLTAALRCPQRPIPADCEQRIAEQLKTERYIFGWVTKSKDQANSVTAEVHLYQKSKQDTVIKETYADNLKDQNDDTLRKLAQRLLDKIGQSVVGAIVVKMGTENGEVVVDGDKRVPMQNGVARLELAPGGHSVELDANGQTTAKRTVLVTAGKETVVDLSLSGGDLFTSDKPFPTRKVIGGGLGVLGVAAGVIAVVNLAKYFEDQDRGDELQASTNPNIRKLPPGKSADDACGKELAETSEICVANSDANRHSAVAIGTGIASGVLLGVGAYLFFVEPSSSEKKSARPRLAPTFGRNGGGFVLSGSF